MSHLSQLLLEKEILLESGTNELEVLVFNIADYTFGINVAKVREVLPAPEITQLPKAHPSIRGVFKLRNQVIPCVSLMDHLGIFSAGAACESTAILTDLNQQQTAFLVDRVERIYRLSWENVLAVPGLTALSRMPVTALTRCGNRLILMLDFEMILDEVTDQYFRTHCVSNPEGVPRDQARIVFVEDSPTVREAVVSTLRESGYRQVISFENGKEAWTWLEEAAEKNEPICDLVIADVEMPQVDGHHLTKRIKSDARLRKIPVLLYSSIITPENRKKGESVGADEQIAKPDLCKVVQLADDLIRKAGLADRTSAACDQNPAEGAEWQAVSQEDCLAPTSNLSAATKPASGSPVVVVGTDGEKPLFANPNVTAAAEVSEDGQSLASPPTTCDDSAVAASESDACPVPPGKNRRLWQTFITELDGRCRALNGLVAALDVGFPDFDALVEMARVLHTVKSASMVVPVEEVTRCTHLVEELVVRLQQAAGSVPKQALERYVAWLEMLVGPPDGDIAAALRSGKPLAEDLEKMLADADSRQAAATA